MSNAIRTISVSLDDFRQLAGEGRLFAILDACDSPEILAKVRDLGAERTLCLYRGDISEELQEVAPYLVVTDEALLIWLKETMWSEPWGIFVVAQLERRKLLSHLRKFLVVQDPDGEALYFRYYDPRVLPVFLSSCNFEEVRDFYGSILAFGVTENECATLFQPR